MSETEQRRGFRAGRVLIEAARVLDPQFEDSLVCLTGAELELLRNVCAYLHRRETYVDTYHGGYYMMPDDEDFDDVQAIVAGLEEKLMGCAEMEALLESIDGYLSNIAFDTNLLNLGRPKLVVNDFGSKVSTGAGEQFILFDIVPEGYVCQVQAIRGINLTNTGTTMQVQCLFGANWRDVNTDINMTVLLPYGLSVPMILEAGQGMRLRFTGSTSSDVLIGMLFAYNIEQP